MSAPSKLVSGLLLAVGLGSCGGRAAPTLDALRLDVRVSTTALDFREVAVHGSSTLTLTLVNEGGPGRVEIGVPVGSAGALFTVTPSGVLALASGAQQILTVTYAPASVASSDDAIFTVTGSGAPMVVSLHGVAVQAGLVIASNPIDFGFVAAGQRATVPLHIEALGAPAEVLFLTVTKSDLDGGVSAFSVPPPNGAIAVGVSMDIPVAFAPDERRRYDATLTLVVSQLGQQTTVQVPLLGYGGGAVMTCTPITLDFGTLPADCSRVTLPIVCTNTGTDVSGDADSLSPPIKATSSPAGVCDVTVPGSDAGVAPGQSVLIDVTCSCQGFDGGEVVITVQFDDGTTMTWHVLGCGPC